jgi:hypothetical protein
MATIRATCTGCGDVELTTADVWVRICVTDQTSTYSFRCPSCADVVIKQAEAHVVELLRSAGVRTQTWHLPAELVEPRAGGAPISHDDLLDFHALLEAEDWFERLTERR